ncbi:MAG: ribbon-helix-helix protein, CopG family [Pseudomonadota bacterium]
MGKEITSKLAVISARVDAETLALIDRIAAVRGRSRAWLVASAVKRMAEDEAAYLAFVQEGIDAVERGDVIPHEEVMQWVAEKRLELQARKAARAA